MATAAGVRFGLAGIPTGLDTEGRYAMAGCPEPANSVAPGAPVDAFRMSVAGMPTPGDTDTRYRAAIGGMPYPTQGGSSFTATKRFFLAGCIMQPDGVITQNDRQALAGIYPTNEESEAFRDVFSLTYTLTPTTTAVQASAGVLDAVINSFISELIAVPPDIGATFYLPRYGSQAMRNFIIAQGGTLDRDIQSDFREACALALGKTAAYAIGRSVDDLWKEYKESLN